MKGSKTIRDRGCGLELTKVPLVPQSSHSTLSMCPPPRGSLAQMVLWCGLKTEQQESHPPRRSLSDQLSLGGLGRAGESCGWGGDEENPPKATGKRAQEFIHRKRRAALAACHPEVALHLMGLDLFLHLHPLSFKLSLERAAFVHTSLSPLGSRPSAQGG